MSSTSSLLDYAKEIEQENGIKTNHAQFSGDESIIINEIQQKGIKDHKIKCDLRNRIKNAEDRISVLESLISKNRVQSTKNKIHSIPNVIQTGICRNGKFETSILKAKAMEAKKLSTDLSSDYSSSSFDDSSDDFVVPSKYRSAKTTKTKRSKHIPIIPTTSRINKQSKNIPVVSHANQKTKQQGIFVKKEEVCDSLSDISSDCTSFSMSSSYSDFESIDSLLDSSSEHDITNKYHFQKAKKVQSYKNTQRTKPDEESMRKAREYIKEHELMSEKLLKEYMDEWRSRNMNKKAYDHIETNEVLNDLEKYSATKFNEFDDTINKIKLNQERHTRKHIKKLEKENSRLRSNMHKIKNVVHDYKRKRGLKKIDEMFGAVTEKQLLMHIATKFHKFLRTEEDISRETAMKLISRASKNIDEQ